MIYVDFPFCTRSIFMQQKLAELPQAALQDCDFTFKIVDYYPCNPQNFINAYYGKSLVNYVSLDMLPA